MNKEPIHINMWYVYIVHCLKDDSLYTGITNNLEKRIAAHNNKKGSKYTRTRLPVKLLISFQAPTKSEASKIEYKIKQLSRREKFKLIEIGVLPKELNELFEME